MRTMVVWEGVMAGAIAAAEGEGAGRGTGEGKDFVVMMM